MNSESDSYYDVNDFSTESQEQTVETPSQPQFNPAEIEQLRTQNQQLTQQVGQIQSWFQQNPYATPQVDPEQQKINAYLDNYLQQKGVITNNEFQQQMEMTRAESLSKENGFVDFNTAYSYYTFAINSALASNQKTAEANQVIGLANQGKYSDAINLAVKYFGKPNNGTLPNMNINTNHSPSNSQNLNQGNYYGSEQYMQDSYSTDAGRRMRAQKAHEDAIKKELGFVQ